MQSWKDLSPASQWADYYKMYVCAKKVVFFNALCYFCSQQWINPCTIYYIWYKTFFFALFLLLPKYLNQTRAFFLGSSLLSSCVISKRRGGEKCEWGESFSFFPPPTTAVLGNGGTAWVSFPSPQHADGVNPLCSSSVKEVHFSPSVCQHWPPQRLIWTVSPCFVTVTHPSGLVTARTTPHWREIQ